MWNSGACFCSIYIYFCISKYFFVCIRKHKKLLCYTYTFYIFLCFEIGDIYTFSWLYSPQTFWIKIFWLWIYLTWRIKIFSEREIQVVLDFSPREIFPCWTSTKFLSFLFLIFISNNFYLIIFYFNLHIIYIIKYIEFNILSLPKHIKQNIIFFYIKNKNQNNINSNVAKMIYNIYIL